LPTFLDIIHVAGYVRRAAKAFHQHEEHREAFARDRLLRILEQQPARSFEHALGQTVDRLVVELPSQFGQLLIE
jgi:hypothetical protein